MVPNRAILKGKFVVHVVIEARSIDNGKHDTDQSSNSTLASLIFSVRREWSQEADMNGSKTQNRHESKHLHPISELSEVLQEI